MIVENPILPQELDPATILPSQVQSDEDTSDEVVEIERFWQSEVERAKKVRDMFIPSWRSARKCWRNKWYPLEDKVAIKNATFYSDVEVTVAALAANSPQFNVSTASVEDVGTASFVKNALKYELNRIKVNKINRQIVRDACIYNIGISKTAYNYKRTASKAADSAYIERVSPFNFLIDPECTDIFDARWAGEEKYLTVEEFKERYNMNTDRAIATASEFIVNTEMASESNTSSRTGKTDRPNQAYDNDMDYSTITPSQVKRIKIVEIYDASEQKVITLADGCILVEVKSYGLGEGDIKYINHLPYRVLRFNTMNEFFYCDSDFEVHKSKIFEIDEVSNRIYESLYRLVPKAVTPKGVINDQEMNKITRSKMATVIPVNVPAGTDLGSIFQWLPMADISPNNWNAVNELKNSHNTDTGIADFMKGASPQGKQTATESMMIQQGAAGRSNYRMSLVDEWLDEVITSLFYVLKYTYDAKKWIPFAGVYPVTRVNPTTGQTEVLKDSGRIVEEKMKGFLLTPDMLQSEYKISIEAGSTGLNSTAQTQALLLNMYKTLQGNPAVDTTVMAKKIINSYGFDPDELLKQQSSESQMPPQQPQGNQNIPVNPAPDGQVVGNPVAQAMNSMPVR